MMDIEHAIRRRQRVVALLESYEGEHVKLVQLMTDLRLDPENDIDTATLVTVCAALVRAGTVKDEYKDRTIYYWIEPPAVRTIADAAREAGIV